ncbi:MAG TPA: hypothetical protein VGK91_08090 [Candidatus Udaeobacter sp.]|jgi:hypothetical protein
MHKLRLKKRAYWKGSFRELNDVQIVPLTDYRREPFARAVGDAYSAI